MTASPCTKVCVMDHRCGHCSGCGRTLAEIAAWGSMTDEERLRVIRRLAGGLPGAAAAADGPTSAA